MNKMGLLNQICTMLLAIMVTLSSTGCGDTQLDPNPNQEEVMAEQPVNMEFHLAEPTPGEAQTIYL